MNLFSLFSLGRLRLPSGSPKAARCTPRRTTSLTLEALEDRSLPSCSSISGFVFVDTNNNGLFDPGEKPFANNSIALRDHAGTIVGRTTTNAAGYYVFTTDSSISTSPRSEFFDLNFPTNKTNQTQFGALPRFNPDLGTLTSIELVISGQITSDVKVENEDLSPATVRGVIAGTLNLSGPDFTTQVTTSSSTKTFTAGPWDHINDFGGPSGKDFGNTTVSGSRTVTLRGAALADFTGTGAVTIRELAQANSSADGGGNLLARISSTGSAHLRVIYHYTPDNCLAGGTYTIIQTTEPPGYLNGKDSRNGTVLPVHAGAGPDEITVTLADNGNAPNNDFGELPPSADLSVVKSATPNPVYINAPLTYTLQVANAGPVTATGVVVRDTLPPDVTFVSASGSGWTCSASGNVVTCTRPSLADGASSVITIMVKAPANAEYITNTVTVTSRTPDNNPGNNHSQATTQVISTDTHISVSVLPPPGSTFANPGQLPFQSKLEFIQSGGPQNLDPTLLAQITYVDGLYRTLLNRPSDFNGLTSLVASLRNGASRDQLVQVLWTSDEHRVQEVATYYAVLLHRAPDPNSLASWVGYFRAGYSENDVIRLFLSSAEYQQTHASDASFVSGLYQDILGRSVDPATLAGWQQALQQGTSRVALISAILFSDEAYLKLIDSSFVNLLHRAPSPGEQQTWLNAFHSGAVSVANLSPLLLASGEFYNLAVMASQS